MRKKNMRSNSFLLFIPFLLNLRIGTAGPRQILLYHSINKVIAPIKQFGSTTKTSSLTHILTSSLCQCCHNCRVLFHLRQVCLPISKLSHRIELTILQRNLDPQNNSEKYPTFWYECNIWPLKIDSIFNIVKERNWLRFSGHYINSFFSFRIYI